MTQIEQHYKNAWEDTFPSMEFRLRPEHQSNIFKAIKTYAEYYAKKCLEKAADEAVVDIVNSEDVLECYVVRASITDITLPEHT